MDCLKPDMPLHGRSGLLWLVLYVFIFSFIPATGYSEVTKVTSTPATDQVNASTQFNGLQNVKLCGGIRVDPKPQGLLNNRYLTLAGVKLLVAPVKVGCVSSGFGFRQRRNKFHKGVDYANRNGGPVLSAADGEVVESIFRKDYGNMILIRHSGNVYTRYAHLESTSVRMGEQVQQGQKIGDMGKSGFATGVHLHYEILLDEHQDGGSSFNYRSVDPFGSQLVARQ